VGKRTAAARTRRHTPKIDTPRVFLPLLAPARYKGAYGGRGSGKSHFFAELLIEDCLCQRGMLAVCIREVQKSLKDSSKRLIEAKLAELRLGEADGFRIYDKEIQTPGGGVILFTGLQDHTAEAIKSLDGFGRAWIEEAQVLSHRARRLFPRIWFDEAATGAGRDALEWYHEKKDKIRAVGLGPEHDWSSHAADAFGLMCIAHEEPERARARWPGMVSREKGQDPCGGAGAGA
jgi:hypothetical protein